jgi:hypothetical protein
MVTVLARPPRATSADGDTPDPGENQEPFVECGPVAELLTDLAKVN